MIPSTMTIQQANVAALEQIAANGGRVEAWPVTEWDQGCLARVAVSATASCANDSAHGKGVCYYQGADGVCLACAVSDLTPRLVWGLLINVEVTA